MRKSLLNITGSLTAFARSIAVRLALFSRRNAAKTPAVRAFIKIGRRRLAFA
jgi:hypothetical protein